MRKILAAVVLLGFFHNDALANTVVPNFTRGTINATTETITKIVEGDSIEVIQLPL